MKDKSITVENKEEATDISTITPMLFVPQELTGWEVNGSAKIKTDADQKKQCYMEISCKIKQKNVYLHGSAKAYKTFYVPCSADWQPAKRYIYTLIFGGGYDDNGNRILIPIESDADRWEDTQ